MVFQLSVFIDKYRDLSLYNKFEIALIVTFVIYFNAKMLSGIILQLIIVVIVLL